MNLKQKMTELADAVRLKAGVAGKLGIDEMIDEINDIEIVKKSKINDVNFYDYDGTAVYGYTAGEALALTELPTLPTHKGLISQGWNWSLEDIKDYVAKYGICDIGALYTTSDGATRLYVVISDIKKAEVPLFFGIDSGNLKITWGDGASENVYETGPRQITHTYRKVGGYTISLLPSEECELTLGRDSEADMTGLFGDVSAGVSNIYTARIQKVELGRGIKKLGSRTFQYCPALRTITIPAEIERFGYCCFNFCYSLQAAIIPPRTQVLSNGLFASCYGLYAVSLPRSPITINYSQHFSACHALGRLVIPDTLSLLPNGFCSRNYGTTSYVIPDSITHLEGGCFYYNTGCYSYDFTNSKQVVSITTRDCFNGKPAEARAKVPPHLFNAWIYADVWRDWNTWFVEAEGITIFKIGASRYGFIEGQTFAEWEFCDDEHFKIENGLVYSVDGLSVCDASGKHVSGSDVITNKDYILN